jgi:hypothetical protein
MHTPARIIPYPTGRLSWGGDVPGTSCQATIARSLRDKSHSPIEGPRIKLALMGLNPWAEDSCPLGAEASRRDFLTFYRYPNCIGFQPVFFGTSRHRATFQSKKRRKVENEHEHDWAERIPASTIWRTEPCGGLVLRRSHIRLAGRRGPPDQTGYSGSLP